MFTITQTWFEGILFGPVKFSVDIYCGSFLFVQAEDMTHGMEKERRRQVLQNYALHLQQDVEKEYKSREGGCFHCIPSSSLIFPGGGELSGIYDWSKVLGCFWPWMILSPCRWFQLSQLSKWIPGYLCVNNLCVLIAIKLNT